MSSARTEFPASLDLYEVNDRSFVSDWREIAVKVKKLAF